METFIIELYSQWLKSQFHSIHNNHLFAVYCCQFILSTLNAYLRMARDMLTFKTIFVTVGTTKFDSLVRTVCGEEILTIFRDLGCEDIIIQYGRGDEIPIECYAFNGMHVDAYKLKPNILDDIRKADLVISHAGAGSCLEILREGKPLVVVINEELMGNHQIELAEQLCDDGNLFYCTPKDLHRVLSTSDFNCLKKYERGNMKIFIDNLDSLMRFK